MNEKSNEPRQKSYFIYAIVVAIGFVLLIISLVFWINSKHRGSIPILVSLGVLSLLEGICNIFIIRSENNYLKAPNYNFDYDKELRTYTYVGKNVKKPKDNAQLYEKYSDWKNHLNNDYEDLMSNDDFYRYLTRKIRNDELYLEVIKTLSIPVGVPLITTCTSTLDSIFGILGCVISFITFVVLVTNEMARTDTKIHFSKDLCGIIIENNNKNKCFA